MNAYAPEDGILRHDVELVFLAGAYHARVYGAVVGELEGADVLGHVIGGDDDEFEIALAAFLDDQRNIETLSVVRDENDEPVGISLRLTGPDGDAIGITEGHGRYLVSAGIVAVAKIDVAEIEGGNE